MFFLIFFYPSRTLKKLQIYLIYYCCLKILRSTDLLPTYWRNRGKIEMGEELINNRENENNIFNNHQSLSTLVLSRKKAILILVKSWHNLLSFYVKF